MPPALSAARARSGGSLRSTETGRQDTSTTTIPTKDTALSANTSVGPDSDTSTPAIAGPMARARLTLMLPSAAAAGIC